MNIPSSLDEYLKGHIDVTSALDELLERSYFSSEKYDLITLQDVISRLNILKQLIEESNSNSVFDSSKTYDKLYVLICIKNILTHDLSLTSEQINYLNILHQKYGGV